jgi:hypothetical protein
MAMLELPVFLSEISRVAELPKFTFPNAMLVGLTLNVRELAMPVPDTAIVTLLSDPVDFTTIDPLTLPAASGKNATVKCVSAPPLSIDIGVLIPDIENPFALVVTLSTHRVVEPVFLTIMILVSVVPTGTSPNGKLSGVTVAYASAARPSPDSGTLNVLLLALLNSSSLPLTLSLMVGANATLNETVSPSLSVFGNVIPLMRYPAPTSESPDTFTAVVPAFFKLTVFVSVWPTLMAPNESEPGSTVNFPVAHALGALPANNSVVKRIARFTKVALPL